MQVRALHRLFTSLSIGITQLAGVWGSRVPTAEEALAQATLMAKRLEIDGEYSPTLGDVSLIDQLSRTFRES
jgi:hypothetical protein